MASSNNYEIISRASPHTIKKFELIESYVETWAQKLMNNPACRQLVYIDCMCNSGVYHDNNGRETEGSPIRVARKLRDVAGQYPNKKVYLYFNDLDSQKIDLLKTRLPSEKDNFRIVLSQQDANVLLKSIGEKLDSKTGLHYFLLYDPYDASIDWEALAPFFRSWGEILINHMVSDPVRSIKRVKNDEKKAKYENTYLTDFENLVPYGSDKKAYEDRVEQIISALKGQRRYFVAAFPFFNSQNAQVYDLLHCTSNIEGFKLYKKTAWKTFGAKSSTKLTHCNEDQISLDFSGQHVFTTESDEACYVVADIAKYIQHMFQGRMNVPVSAIWKCLEIHPIFPDDGYRTEIREMLKNTYGATVKMVPNAITGKRETVISFSKRII